MNRRHFRILAWISLVAYFNLTLLPYQIARANDDDLRIPDTQTRTRSSKKVSQNLNSGAYYWTKFTKKVEAVGGRFSGNLNKIVPVGSVLLNFSGKYTEYVTGDRISGGGLQMYSLLLPRLNEFAQNCVKKGYQQLKNLGNDYFAILRVQQRIADFVPQKRLPNSKKGQEQVVSQELHEIQVLANGQNRPHAADFYPPLGEDYSVSVVHVAPKNTGSINSSGPGMVERGLRVVKHLVDHSRGLVTLLVCSAVAKTSGGQLVAHNFTQSRYYNLTGENHFGPYAPSLSDLGNQTRVLRVMNFVNVPRVEDFSPNTEHPAISLFNSMTLQMVGTVDVLNQILSSMFFTLDNGYYGEEFWINLQAGTDRFASTLPIRGSIHYTKDPSYNKSPWGSSCEVSVDSVTRKGLWDVSSCILGNMPSAFGDPDGDPLSNVPVKVTCEDGVFFGLRVDPQGTASNTYSAQDIVNGNLGFLVDKFFQNTTALCQYFLSDTRNATSDCYSSYRNGTLCGADGSYLVWINGIPVLQNPPSLPSPQFLGISPEGWTGIGLGVVGTVAGIVACCCGPEEVRDFARKPCQKCSDDSKCEKQTQSPRSQPQPQPQPQQETVINMGGDNNSN